MSIQITVPSMVCEACAKTVTNAIKSLEPDAHIQVDLDSKTVTVEGNVSEAALKEAITAKGHQIASQS